MSHASPEMIQENMTSPSLEEVFKLFYKGRLDLNKVENQLIFARALTQEALTERKDRQ